MSNNVKLLAVVVVVLAIGGAFFLSGKHEAKAPVTVVTSVTASDAQKIGTEFVTLVHAREFDKAYALLHKNLQAKLSRPAFEKLILDNKADKAAGVNWATDEVGGGVRTVQGTTPSKDMNITIKATELENNGKAGILLFHFQPAKK